jgi:hypothetical protein
MGELGGLLRSKVNGKVLPVKGLGMALFSSPHLLLQCPSSVAGYCGGWTGGPLFCLPAVFLAGLLEARTLCLVPCALSLNTMRSFEESHTFASGEDIIKEDLLLEYPEGVHNKRINLWMWDFLLFAFLLVAEMGNEYHVSGSAGRTLKTDSLRISTVPGFASLGFLTYRARVQDTATTPPSLALL